MRAYADVVAPIPLQRGRSQQGATLTNLPCRSRSSRQRRFHVPACIGGRRLSAVYVGRVGGLRRLQRWVLTFACIGEHVGSCVSSLFHALTLVVSSLATLPGQEDVAGLAALLDPSTLPGRVARINLLTRGSNAMFLAMTPPRSPTRQPVLIGADGQPQDVEKLGVHVEGGIAVHATG